MYNLILSFKQSLVCRSAISMKFQICISMRRNIINTFLMINNIRKLIWIAGVIEITFKIIFLNV